MAPKDSFITLFTGAKMPKLGLGTWAPTNVVNRDQHNPHEFAEAVKVAIEHGYRHIDTAWAYFNEAEIGAVLKDLLDRGVVKRDELFITTKLHPVFFRPEEVEPTLKDQLKKLGLDYIDMYLMHAPIPFKKDPENPNVVYPMKDGKPSFDYVDHLDTWKALEACVKKGLTRHIGISNFNSKQIQRIFDNCEIKPANLQVECHAYFPQEELKAFCDKLDIAFTCYSPIGSPGAAVLAAARGVNNFPILLKDPTVVKIAEKHHKSPAQVLIRYLFDRNCCVIPKSTNPERIKQNFDIFDFSISPEEIKELNGLKKDRLMGSSWAMFKDHPEYPLNEPF